MKYELIRGETFNYINYNICLEGIIQIIFTDKIAPKGVELDDLSNDRDGSVVGWKEDDGVYKVSTQTKGMKVIFNRDCESMFDECLGLKKIVFEMVDTSKVEYTSYMFYECTNLTNLDLSSFDTSNVTNMNHMFAKCENLEKLDLSNFNTSKVQYMSGMFEDCEKLSIVKVNDDKLKEILKKNN